MIPYGKGSRTDQGNLGNLLLSEFRPMYNTSSSIVYALNEPMTSRGVKSAWYEGPTTQFDWHGIYLANCHSVAPFTSDRKISVDVGIGDVGSETMILESITFDYPSHTRCGIHMYIPLFVPKGETIHFRMCYYADTTSGDCHFRPIANHGFMRGIDGQRIFRRSETIGIDTVAAPVEGNLYGVLLNPSTANTWTSWAEIGTTTFDWHAFYPMWGRGFDGLDPSSNPSAGPYNFLYQIGIGGSQDVIIDSGFIEMPDTGTGRSDWINGDHKQNEPLEMYIPSGTTFYARMRSSVVADVASRSKDLKIVGFG